MARRIIINERKSDGKTETLKYLDSISKDLHQIEKKPKGKKADFQRCKYISTFDFETTNDKSIEQAWVYSWAFCFRKKRIIGRTIDSCCRFFDMLSKELGDTRLLCYIHNESFDWHFISGFYPFKPEECFFTMPRKILYSIMNGVVELRCSYLLTGLSLANFTKEMNVKHKKQSGEKYDYSKLRTPRSGLKAYEIKYIDNDVLGLEEALEKFFQIENDTVWTIPLTKTGFVRRDLKEALKKISYKKRLSWQLDYDSFKACEEAFRGGNTHASRFYADPKVVVKDCYSNDFASSYPFVMLTSNHFPKRNFTRKGRITLDDFFYYTKNLGYCGIFRVKFWQIKLKDKYWGVPYIALSKVRNEKFDRGSGIPYLDNGRITEALYMETTVTDIDLYIILSEYTFENIEIYDSFLSACGALPDPVKEVIMKYFRLKTELKGVDGQETIYMNNKTKLNATFGCCVMNPCKATILYDTENQNFTYSSDKTERELLEKYQKKGFLPYSIGVFITALARWNLEYMLRKLPPLAFVYADTDSIKYHGVDPDIFSDWNKHAIELCEKGGYFAYNKKGEKCYLGTFDQEGHMKELKILGAKKYCYITDDNELHLTCAGVSKKKGAKELLENGGIKAFKNGFIFKKGGGTTAKFNDETNEWIERGGEKIHLLKNIYIEDSEYTLGQTDDYKAIIDFSKKLFENDIEEDYNCGIIEL